MRTMLAFLLVFAMVCGGTAHAKKKKQDDPNAGYKFMISEVNVLSITVSVGKDGTVHETYKITPATTVTIDGAPATARDLLAGMLANINVADDKTTATSIDASDPKGLHGKH